MNSHHKPTWGVRFLCILMSGLTACATNHPQNVWRDKGAQDIPGMARPAQILDSWGTKPEGPEVADPEIAPGFLLTMHSLSDTKLNGEFRVGFKGELSLPYDVTVNATHMTLSDLQNKLTELYRPYFKTSSDIDLKIKERRYWLDVRGLVEKPGQYLVEPESSLDYVIGLAGGTSKSSPPLYVRIQKGNKVFVFDLEQYYSEGEDHPQILGWMGGEVLFFQKELGSSIMDQTNSSSLSRTPVYMLGEVKKPGEYILNPQSDFLDSLVLAGGFTDRADLEDIEVIRRTAGRKRVFDFSWRDFQDAPAPQQGDIVIVHADNTTKFERHTALFATLVGALAAVATAAVLVLAYHKGGLGTTQ